MLEHKDTYCKFNRLSMPRPHHHDAFMAINHYENFPVASYLCPPKLRSPIAALYHFARTADDIADEGNHAPEHRLATLYAYRQELDAAGLQQASKSTKVPRTWSHVFGPLRRVLVTHQLPTQLLHDLLDAFVQDVEKTKGGKGYATKKELLGYCSRSANPIGRLLLYLYKIEDAQALIQSDQICSALQLINFWQDLSIDIPRGRYYLSADMCTPLGLSPHQIPQPEESHNANRLIVSCTHFANATLQQGLPLVHKIPGRAGWELRLVVQGATRILEKVEKMGHRVFRQRPVLRWWDFPVVLWRALWM